MAPARLRGFTVLTLTAVFGAAAAWWLGRSEPALAPPRTASPASVLAAGGSREQEPGPTAAQVNDLRRELDALRQQNQQLAQRVDSVGARIQAPPSGPTPPAVPLTPQEAEAHLAPRRAALFDGLEQAVRREAREEAWAARTESLAAEALRQEATGSAHLEHLECRTQLCRIELSHADAQAGGPAVEQLITTPGLRGEFIVQRLDTEQPPRTVLYVAREGMRLPRTARP